jgi:hypothetical protein
MFNESLGLFLIYSYTLEHTIRYIVILIFVIIKTLKE